jgi:hypothetical protein
MLHNLENVVKTRYSHVGGKNLMKTGQLVDQEEI